MNWSLVLKLLLSFRPLNLLMALLILFFTQYALIVKLAGNDYTILSCFSFNLYAISSILVMAAGYLINDFCDRHADRINKPEKSWMLASRHRTVVVLIYFLMNFLGLGLAGWVSVQHGGPGILIWQSFFFLSLLIYSLWLKCQLVFGNLLMAFLAGASILALLIFQTKSPIGFKLDSLVTIIIGYAAFAFVLTLKREVLKDVQDLKGDESTGCRSIPIVCGARRTSLFLRALGILIIPSLIVTAFVLYSEGFYSVIWFLIGVMGLLLLILIGLFKELNVQRAVKLSLLSKWAMLVGIISMCFW